MWLHGAAAPSQPPDHRRPVSRKAAAGVLTVVASSLVLAACGSQSSGGGSAAASSPPAAAPTPGSATTGTAAACAASELKITLTHTGAVTGHVGGYLKYTNVSKAPCSLSGWPVVVGLTAAGQSTTLVHAQSTMLGAWRYVSPPPTLTLAPGAAAYSVVAADDQPVAAATSCPPPYTHLRVSPPGSSGDAVISAYLPADKTDLPSCLTASGSSSAVTSTITPLSSLAH
jgi:Protein of unknown function (DUF4232)